MSRQCERVVTSKSSSVISSIVAHESKPASINRSRYLDIPSHESVSSRSAMSFRRPGQSTRQM